MALYFPRKRKTKIVATLGPASNSPEIIRQLIESGMDIARLNFSHGTHTDHTCLLRTVREEAAKLKRHIVVFQDLCGPKVRIADLENGEIMLEEKATISLQHFTGQVGNEKVLYVEAFDPAKIIKTGEKAFLADGRIELLAEEVTRDSVRCSVVAGGILRSRSGIAVPDSKLDLPSLTQKDIIDVQWGIENEIDYIALSFVNSAKDILMLRDKIRLMGGDVPVIAKIERAKSIDHVTEIIELSDAVMIARGDLGLELPLERVPRVQKLIIEAANHNGTPVITATQMLQSMVTELRPTRAEVSDVYSAVYDGTDAVMLSEETAVGRNPVNAVKVLDRIVEEAGKEFQFDQYSPRLKGADRETVADAICYAACGAATKVAAAAILACTHSGHTAKLMAKYRPAQTLFGVTSQVKTLSRMALYWGVQPILIKLSDDSTTEEEVMKAMISVRDQGGIKPGSRVVLTAGLRTNQRGTTTLMEIREIPRNV